jgi:NADH-quinone oxidoreductase subunit N
VIFAIAMSVVSLYYYLKVLKQIYVVELPVETVFQKASWPIKIVLILLALAVVILGAAPDLLVAPLLAAIRSVAL